MAGSQIVVGEPDVVEGSRRPETTIIGLPRADAGAPNSGSLRRRLVAVDAAAYVVAWTTGLVVFGDGSGSVFGVQPLLVLVPLASAVAVAASSALGLYRRSVCSVRAVEIGRVLHVSAITALVLWPLLATTTIDGRLRTTIAGVLIAATIAASARAAFQEWLTSCRLEGRFRTPVIIVGGGIDAASLATLLAEDPTLGYEPTGFVGPLDDAPTDGRTSWLGERQHAVQAALDSGASGAIVVSSSMGAAELNEVVRALASAGLHVHVSSGLRGVARHRLLVGSFVDEAMLYLEPLRLRARQAGLKRALDLVVGSILLLLATPVLVAAAVAIRWHDGGPVLFRQQRIGRDGRPFTLYKLRTMVVDAERHLDTLLHRNERTGPLFKLEDDPRVTGVGRLLRATSLDELPQLFNVLGGSMSLVGPRPALPSEVVAFDDELLARLAVRPGLTGLWQIGARDNPSFELYRRFDLLYVRNWSVALDLVLIAATVRSVISRALRSLYRVAAGRRAAVARPAD